MKKRKRIAVAEDVARDWPASPRLMNHGFDIRRESKSIVSITFDVATPKDEQSLTATLRIPPGHALLIARKLREMAEEA